MILKISILAIAFVLGRLSKRINLANNRKYKNILIYLGYLIKNQGATVEELTKLRDNICYNNDIFLTRNDKS